MYALTSKNATSSKSYRPPSSLRNHQHKTSPLSQLTITADIIAKKSALKKEFVIEQMSFPALHDTLKKSNNQGTVPISFSSAASKKTLPPPEKVIDVLPGWVHIRRQHNGEIQYKYGESRLAVNGNKKAEDRLDQFISRIILKNRIAREQYDRDIDIERLGDLSEYYGQPSVAEMYDHDIAYVNDGSASSDYNDSDYYE